MAETNNLQDVGIAHSDTDYARGDIEWTDPDLAQIIRIRLLSDPGFPAWDVSYVLGLLHDGTQVKVRVPFYQVSKRRYLNDMYTHARRDGVYLNRLCGGNVQDVLSRLQ